MSDLTEQQESCRNDFLHDMSQALAVTQASVSSALQSDPSLRALACTYKRLPPPPDAAPAE